MRILLTLLLSSLAIVVWRPAFAEDEAPPAPAAEEPPPAVDEEPQHVDTPEAQAARAAWDWTQAITDFSRAQGGAAMKLRKAAGGDKARQDAVLKLLRENYTRLKPIRDPANEAFREAFAKVDRKTFVRPEHEADDRKILERGLTMLAQQAMEGDPTHALALWEELIQTAPESRIVKSARTYYIPTALMSLPNTATAVAKFESLIESADEATRPAIMLKLGDMHARDLEYEKAAATYAEAAKLLPEGKSRTRGDIEMRQKLVGKAAPALGDAVWTNMDATTLEALKGKLVLLDFWATWCGPCRAVMPALEKLHKDHAAEGLVVLGVTKDSPGRGYLPAKGDLPAERYEGTTAEDFLAHLKAFRERMDISYPFVIADKKLSGEKYGVRGIPTLVLIDADGTIGYVSVGSGGKAALKTAIAKRLGAAKANPDGQ